MMQKPLKSRRGFGSPGSGFTGSCELLDEFLNLGLLQEQKVHLSPELYL